MSITTSCYLYSQSGSSPIYLPDNEELFVGRTVETQITDTRCSRKQVRLLACYKERYVTIQQHGKRPCGFNGFKTVFGEKYIARHGDALEIVYGKHLYKIEFNPPPQIKIFESPKKLPQKYINSDDSDESRDSEDENNASCSSKQSKLDISNIMNMEKYLSQNPLTESIKKISDAPCTVTSSSKKSDDSIESGKWEHFGNKTLYVYTSNGCTGRSKIAAYDMDKTLIKTKSGLQFPKDANDWEILYPEVPGKLKKYYDIGYKIVVFSNQANLGAGRITLKDFKLKIERLVTKIGIPMQVYLAVGQSIYRKPRTGMWDCLTKQMNDDVSIDKENSFFVGDAAGRPASASRKKKDHSLADRLLAINLDLTFYTPEEHFLKHKKVSYNAPTFHPKEASKNTILFEPSQAKLISNQQEIIIMVGSPGSGKSHFVKTHLKSYFYVNRDTLGNWQKCVTKTKEALSNGKSVVVDNTNPDKVSRQRYIDIAKEYNIPVRCFVMNIDKEHIKHNNMFRILTDSSHEMISDMVINSYGKNFIPPSEDEGFSEILKINFVPSFNSEEDRKLYEMYLIG